MQTTLFTGARGFPLVVLVAAVIGSAATARAQEPPSLSGAVSSDGGPIWSAGDAGAALTGPALSEDYLQPIPAGEGVELGAPYGGPPCNTCNGAGGAVAGALGPYNRCGCSTQTFPWHTGPGHCDNWCVGPHWNVELEGMFMQREDADWDRIAGATVLDEFDFGPGVRLVATGYNAGNYGLQVAYEGVNDFESTAVTATNRIEYESHVNSLEINLIRRTLVPLKFFAGVRYVEIDEDYVDTTVATTDSLAFLVENRLIGVQVGGFRDAWELNRWLSIEPFGNVGAYFNDYKREDLVVTPSTTIGVRSEFSEMAYLGEAGVTSILRINRCLALRGGYQIMAVSGVGEALDASLTASLNDQTQIYHGAKFGVEYRR